MRVEWRLRLAAAERGVWTSGELRRLLGERAGYELSHAALYVLLTKQPQRIKIQTLTALCTALQCTPNDLLVLLPDDAGTTSPPTTSP